MRRKKKEKRPLAPDPLYGNLMVSKFINQVMRDGKKSLARNIVYTAFKIIEEKEKKNPLVVFDEALKNVAPSMEVKPRRVGGATYQVPREVRGERKIFLAMSWIINAARTQRGKPMAEKLAQALISSSYNEGAAVKKKLDTHRMAEANRAFAHYAW